MRNFNKTLTVFSFIYILLFTTSCNSVPGVKEGNIAPDFKLMDVNNKAHKLSDFKGKVVMVHFWTDWCNSCRAEFPRIQQYYSEISHNDFELIAINLGQPATVSEDFKNTFNIEFPMLVDKDKITADLFNVNVFPTNFFIDPDGKIIRVIKGWASDQQVKVIVNQNKKEQSASF